MTSPIAGIDTGVIRQLLNVGASFAALQIVAQIVESLGFDDLDTAGIDMLPLDLRTHTLARIVEATVDLREELRHIDGLLITLTAGQHVPS